MSTLVCQRCEKSFVRESPFEGFGGRWLLLCTPCLKELERIVGRFMGPPKEKEPKVASGG